VRDCSPRVSSAMEAATETKFGTRIACLRGEDDARTWNTRIAQIKRAIPHSTVKNMTRVTETGDVQ